jgi:hypothetical protein
MKQIGKSIILVLGILILNFSFAGLAMAEVGMHINGFHLGFEGHRNHYNSNHGHRNHFPNHNSHKHSKHSRHFTYGSHYSDYRRPCHQVSKIEYDGYGYSHRVAGTMCYDRSGRGYIVAGSRHHIN